MATEGGGKEMNEIKTQFTTREGLYKLLPNSEYSRPNRVPFNSQGSNPVRVSFVNLNDQSGNGDRLCFNVGRELYFYIYKGVRKAADLSKPIDKRIYKGTQPTCHDFNHLTATAESVSLLVGFSAGQVQLIDPIKKETSKLFNEERRCGRIACKGTHRTAAPRRKSLLQGRGGAGVCVLKSCVLLAGASPPGNSSSRGRCSPLMTDETNRQVTSNLCQMGSRFGKPFPSSPFEWEHVPV
ncbi:WD repeat-containing protein 20 isoform X7 [Myotis lucifugus]|uniref:WD repeat-containing protein 20 isoform X7 n=1 Tax=Myotis lucifugus TaxID=59463 RepID=UPI000CCC5CD5|nr:WD repeat-containing protein 20 isoform X7 [Myotis lucifugus]